MRCVEQRFPEQARTHCVGRAIRAWHSKWRGPSAQGPRATQLFMSLC